MVRICVHLQCYHIRDRIDIKSSRPILSHQVRFLIFYVFFYMNAFFFLSLFKKKRKKNFQKNPGNYFLINLAIADLGKLFVKVLMNWISSAHRRWMFGDMGCDLYGIFGGLFGFTTIMTTVLMSAERYFIIRNPLNALKLKKKHIFSNYFILFFL